MKPESNITSVRCELYIDWPELTENGESDANDQD
jgi:hypothetical protein